MIPLYTIVIKEIGHRELLYEERRMAAHNKPYNRIYHPEHLPRAMKIEIEDCHEYRIINVSYQIANSKAWIQRLPTRDSKALYNFLGRFNYTILPMKIVGINEIIQYARNRELHPDDEDHLINRTIGVMSRHHKLTGSLFKLRGPWMLKPGATPCLGESRAHETLNKSIEEEVTLDTLIEKMCEWIPKIFELNDPRDKVTTYISDK